MYSHLSSKEKKKKLAQARKRAINWSAQQQVLSKLRNTTSKSQNLAQSSSTNKLKSNRETSLKKPPETSDLSFFTPIPLSDENTNTIRAIQQTLLDLQNQKEAIDITIEVLQRRLHFLLNTKTHDE